MSEDKLAIRNHLAHVTRRWGSECENLKVYAVCISVHDLNNPG